MNVSRSHAGACPAPRDLVAFRQGSLSPDRAEEVAQHLTACPSCHEAFLRLFSSSETPSADPSSGSSSGPGDAGDIDAGHGSDDSRFSRTTIPGGGTPESGERPLPDPPRVLGQYRIEERLGRGGMGAVYRAFHTRLKRWVALKVLPPERTHDPLAVARFFREMEAIGRLDHPNLVRATDAGEAAGIHYLVMDLVEGVDLGKLVRRLGPLPIPDACEMALQAAQGLACIAGHGLVHRDVKPSNLILSSRGQVKILDLGLARLGEHRPGGAELSGNVVMGTGDYMAPEQWASSHHVDIRADIYSLGCTLYKLLTGKAPYEGPACATTHNKMLAHTLLPVPPPEGRRPDIPGALAGVLRRMLAKKPEDRQADAAEVVEALRPFTRGHALTALLRGEPGSPRAAPPVPGSTPEESPPRPPSRLRRPALPALILLAGCCLATAGMAAYRMGYIPLPSGGTGTAVPAPHAPPERPGPASPGGGKPAGEQPAGGTGGRWVDALVQEPAPQDRLRWPKITRGSQMQWLPEERDLWITCNEVAAVRLGEVDAPDYTLRVTLFQNRWESVGVFFGGRLEGEDEGLQFHYQSLGLLRLAGVPPEKDRFLLEWNKTRYLPTTDSSRSIPVSSLEVPAPLPVEQTFVLTIRQGTLTSVSWGGKDLPGLLTTPYARQLRPPPGLSYQGAFGVLVGRTTCFVRDASYLVSKEP